MEESAHIFACTPETEFITYSERSTTTPLVPVPPETPSALQQMLLVMGWLRHTGAPLPVPSITPVESPLYPSNATLVSGRCHPCGRPYALAPGRILCPPAPPTAAPVAAVAAAATTEGFILTLEDTVPPLLLSCNGRTRVLPAPTAAPAAAPTAAPAAATVVVATDATTYCSDGATVGPGAAAAAADRAGHVLLAGVEGVRWGWGAPGRGAAGEAGEVVGACTCGEGVAVVHVDGAISVYEYPSTTPRFIWIIPFRPKSVATCNNGIIVLDEKGEVYFASKEIRQQIPGILTSICSAERCWGLQDVAHGRALVQIL